MLRIPNKIIIVLLLSCFFQQLNAQKVGLVLSGGGAKGFAHVGVLKILEDAELVRSFKDGLWVNYSLSDGNGSPYSSSMIGNLKHWLDDETEIKELSQILPGIDRHDIVGK